VYVWNETAWELSQRGDDIAWQGSLHLIGVEGAHTGKVNRVRLILGEFILARRHLQAGAKRGLLVLGAVEEKRVTTLGLDGIIQVVLQDGATVSARAVRLVAKQVEHVADVGATVSRAYTLTFAASLHRTTSAFRRERKVAFVGEDFVLRRPLDEDVRV